jgi:hypothetical protein
VLVLSDRDSAAGCLNIGWFSAETMLKFDQDPKKTLMFTQISTEKTTLVLDAHPSLFPGQPHRVQSIDDTTLASGLRDVTIVYLFLEAPALVGQKAGKIQVWVTYTSEGAVLKAFAAVLNAFAAVSSALFCSVATDILAAFFCSSQPGVQ